MLLPPSLAGGAIGSLLVAVLPGRYFDALVPWLLLTAALLFGTIIWQSATAGRRDGAAVARNTCAAVIFFQLLVSIWRFRSGNWHFDAHVAGVHGAGRHPPAHERRVNWSSAWRSTAWRWGSSWRSGWWTGGSWGCSPWGRSSAGTSARASGRHLPKPVVQVVVILGGAGNGSRCSFLKPWLQGEASMDEKQWRTCTDPDKMLAYLPDKATVRLLRRSALACHRRLTPEPAAGDRGEVRGRRAVRDQPHRADEWASDLTGRDFSSQVSFSRL